MTFQEARVAMGVLERYQCGQCQDWGSEENRKRPIEGIFEFEHDKCWITLPRASDDPEVTASEREALEGADWFFDDENGAWCHF